MLEISEISLSVSDSQETIHEVTFLQPLEKKSRLAGPHVQTPIKPDTLNRIKRLCFKFLKWLVPGELKSEDATFKTALAQLLSLPSWQSTPRRARLIEVAKSLGVDSGISPEEADSTFLNGIQLEGNLKQLAFQTMIIGEEAIKRVQCLILDEIERKPILSILRIQQQADEQSFDLSTSYRKYKVHTVDEKGQVLFECSADRGTSSVRTKESIFPDLRGVVGQRLVETTTGKQLIGTYSGELTTKHHVLEQILCMLQITSEQVTISQQLPANETLTILFTSLYAWQEFELITRQRRAIQGLHQMTLQVGGRAIGLNLLYLNIPFNRWSRLPVPPETKAILHDANEEALIALVYLALEQLNLPTGELQQWRALLNTAEPDFFKQETNRLRVIDAFRLYKQTLAVELEVINKPLARLLRALLLERRYDDHPLRGMDQLLYLEELTHLLGIKHHKNCHHAVYRSSAAQAADKAQYVFKQLTSRPFLPGNDSGEGEKLFSSLYTLYLLWEEPEVHMLMSTGDTHTFQPEIRKHPEIARYLVA